MRENLLHTHNTALHHDLAFASIHITPTPEGVGDEAQRREGTTKETREENPC